MSSSPHDALFKEVLGQLEHARGILRWALPAAVAEAIDWQTLARCPGNFIDAELTERNVDLLFSASYRDGGETLVYVLFEHQSTVDDRMAFRVLRYAVRIWERWLADHPYARVLPAIVPLVLYHGDRPWSAPLEISEMFDLPHATRAALSPHLIRFSYLVKDVSKATEAQLRAGAMQPLVRLVIVCFRHARGGPGFLDVLGGWNGVIKDVNAGPNGREALVIVSSYILQVNGYVKQEDLEVFLVRVVGPQAKEIVMTAGERLIAQGREEGREEGREKGIQQAESKTLLRQLRRRFGGLVDSEIERRVTDASHGQLEVWLDRVVSAATLADVLAE